MEADWRTAAETAKATPEVITILQTVAEHHGLHPCARGGAGEVGMGAAPDAYAAFYVSHRGITLAMDPEQARLLGDWAGLPAAAKNDTTHYLKCPADRLTDRAFFNRVEQAARSALLRSWQGPRWTRLSHAGTHAPMSPTCPLHNLELAANGFCMSCDDIAPAL